MYPKLFDLGPLSVYTYGLLLAASYLLGLRVAMARSASRGIDPNRMLDLGVYIILSALVGAKLLLVAIDFEYFVENPRDIFSLFRAGGVFYGGLILASLVTMWYVRRHRLSMWNVGDAVAPGIALGHVVGRVGCFLGGCCYGRETHVPWAVTFTSPEAAANVGTPLGIPLHPTQLYEAGAELLILLWLLSFEKRGRNFTGRTFFSYLFVYGITRFIIEFYRGDPRGMVLGWLSTSQLISLMLVPISAVMLVRLARRAPAAPPTASARRVSRPSNA